MKEQARQQLQFAAADPMASIGWQTPGRLLVKGEWREWETWRVLILLTSTDERGKSEVSIDFVLAESSDRAQAEKWFWVAEERLATLRSKAA